MKAVIYTRRSTDKQDTTHASQEAECRAWAQARGYEVGSVFSDDCSGSVEVVTRPAFLEMINSLKAGDVVVIKRRDRLGRDAMGNAIAERHIEQLGARLISTCLGDVDTPEGRLLKGIMDQVAAFELALIKARTSAALKQRKEQGLLTGSAPLGMKADEEGKLLPDEEERARVERARELRRSGLTIKQVTSKLAEEGIVSRSGKAPSWTTVRDWVKGISAPKRQAPPKSAKTKRSDTQSRLVIDAIKAIRAEGHSIRKTATLLAERYPEIKNSKGKSLAPTQIARLLRVG